MAIGNVFDEATGWSFYAVLEEPGSGYVVQQLRHDGHECGRMITVEGIMVASQFKPKTAPKQPYKFETFTLGSPRLTRLGDPSVVNLGTKATDPRGYYNPRFAVATKYRITNVFDEPDQELRFEYRLIFTPYSKDPTHEPGGFLKAARVYPTIIFEAPAPTSGKLKEPNNRIAAIRVIYRLGMFVVEGKTYTNQAGIFRDNDLFGKVEVLEGAAGKGVAALIFDRAEKPLISEIVGRGIVRNTNRSVLRGDMQGWDNIHLWNGGFKTKDEFLKAAKGGFPPTPGLPYGVHQHWRWGASYSTALTGLWKGDPQYGGIGGAGGPMLDPAIPDQLLEFAITQGGLREERVRQMLNDQTTHKFDTPLEEFIVTSHTEPENISLGVSLVTWIDITAYSKNVMEEAPFTKACSETFAGTIFAHGIFFAHDSEDVLPPISIPQARDVQYIPTTPIPSNWRRP